MLLGSLNLYFFFICCLFSVFNYFIVVQLYLSAFSLHTSTPPQPNPPASPASTLPHGFVHVSFIVVPENLPPIIPSRFHSGDCQIVLTFSISDYILLAFLFC